MNLSPEVEKNIELMEVIEDALLQMIKPENALKIIEKQVIMDPVIFIKEFMTIGFKAPRQCGKSRFIAKQLMKTPSSIYVTATKEQHAMFVQHIEFLDKDKTFDMNRLLIAEEMDHFENYASTVSLADVKYVYLDDIYWRILVPDIIIKNLHRHGLPMTQAAYINIY